MFMRRNILLPLFVLVMLSASHARAQTREVVLAQTREVVRKPTRAVVVIPLLPIKVDQEVAEGIVALVEDELVTIPDVKHLPMTRRVGKMIRACSAKDVSCLAKAADRRGADFALMGSLMRVRGALKLRLELLEVAEGRIVGRTRELLAGDTREISYGVRRAVVSLLLPESFTGSLTVDCNVKKAVVRVDGVARMTTPSMDPITGLREGPHQVQISKAGYDVYEQTVDIVYEKNYQLQAVLLRRTDMTEAELAALAEEEAPEKEFVPDFGVTPWVATAAGVFLIAGGVASGILSLLDSLEVERRAKSQILVFPNDSELVERGRGEALLANILYAVGGAVVVAGVSVGVWQILAAPEEPELEQPEQGTVVEHIAEDDPSGSEHTPEQDSPASSTEQNGADPENAQRGRNEGPGDPEPQPDAGKGAAEDDREVTSEEPPEKSSKPVSAAEPDPDLDPNALEDDGLPEGDDLPEGDF